jgi:RNA polymerase sigma-70 factor (ECF subfamily)
MPAVLPAPVPPLLPPREQAGPARARLELAEIYEEYFTFVWRSALRLGTARAHVDDVVQETFLVAHRRLPGFEGRSSMKTWLFGILFNVVRAQRRSRAAIAGATADADPEAVADPAGGPHERAAKVEAARLVERVLAVLDDDKRAVFVLAELEQMSAPDIAATLAIPLNTVYSRLRLARREFADAAARHRARDEWRIR